MGGVFVAFAGVRKDTPAIVDLVKKDSSVCVALVKKKLVGIQYWAYPVTMGMLPCRV